MRTHPRIPFCPLWEDWRLKIERVGNLNYPEEARRNGIYGSLILSVEINADGSLKIFAWIAALAMPSWTTPPGALSNWPRRMRLSPEALKRDFDYLHCAHLDFLPARTSSLQNKLADLRPAHV